MQQEKAYSDFIHLDGWIYFSGKTGAVADGTVPDDFAQQAEQAINNLKAVMSTADCTVDNLVKVTIFLTSMDDYVAFNEIYVSHFPGRRPARSCVAVSGLPRNAKVEVEAVAYVGKHG
ncbi:RidA family protein [Pseudomonas sichuanensis]|uniref:RidA family protein n=1 Tax=Pseudomonas sichuanensis TaxID=2213015 RepID=UPI002AB98F01|nr:RidA family protein [Pseudomonas sichuanensis]MDZ4019277.1 2-iminobutanoate/2-iminopropanoate deaminase [Pseudomonas sichuanensis]